MVDRETGGADDLHPERGRHGRAGAQHLPLDPRAPRVHAPGVRAGRVRRAPDERRDRRHLARRRAPDARAVRQVRALPDSARGRHGGPLVPRPALAPLSGRLELPHRQAVQRRSAGPGGRPAHCENASSGPEQRSPTSSASTARPNRRPCRSTPASRRTTSRRSASRCPRTTRLPSYTGLEEDVSVHLQAFRLGDILFTVCSCEQWFDQSRNIKTRTDKVQGNEHHGYDWAARCTYNGDRPAPGPAPTRGTRRPTCPRSPTKNFLRMKAQVNNHANGWNDLSNVPVGGVRADGPDQDQGQLHPLRAGARTRLPPDGSDLHGQRLQRLHRDLPRVPARRPLPQGPDRLGPALQRLHGHAPGGDGRRAERRPHGRAASSGRRRSRRTSRSTTSARTSSARSARRA